MSPSISFLISPVASEEDETNSINNSITTTTGTTLFHHSHHRYRRHHHPHRTPSMKYFSSNSSAMEGEYPHHGLSSLEHLAAVAAAITEDRLHQDTFKLHRLLEQEEDAFDTNNIHSNPHQYQHYSNRSLNYTKLSRSYDYDADSGNVTANESTEDDEGNGFNIHGNFHVPRQRQNSTSSIASSNCSEVSALSSADSVISVPSRGRPKAKSLSKTTQSQRGIQIAPDQKCSNCGTVETPLWRRSIDEGTIVCNACGLYFKLHGHHRPISLIRPGIRRRNRCPSQSSTDLDSSTNSLKGEIVALKKKGRRPSVNGPHITKTKLQSKIDNMKVKNHAREMKAILSKSPPLSLPSPPLSNIPSSVSSPTLSLNVSPHISSPPPTLPNSPLREQPPIISQGTGFLSSCKLELPLPIPTSNNNARSLPSLQAMGLSRWGPGWAAGETR